MARGMASTRLEREDGRAETAVAARERAVMDVKCILEVRGGEVVFSGR
jgi:hypothetical protein